LSARVVRVLGGIHSLYGSVWNLLCALPLSRGAGIYPQLFFVHFSLPYPVAASHFLTRIYSSYDANSLGLLAFILGMYIVVTSVHSPRIICWTPKTA
jgi:hypothetical protein